MFEASLEVNKKRSRIVMWIWLVLLASVIFTLVAINIIPPYWFKVSIIGLTAGMVICWVARKYLVQKIEMQEIDASLDLWMSSPSGCRHLVRTDDPEGTYLLNAISERSDTFAYIRIENRMFVVIKK